MSGFRIMVVAEQPSFRSILVRLVQERGFEAFPAADGIDALRQIYHVQPHVIVSDAALPNLSGFQLLPFVRRRFPEIGVIALRDDQRDQESALSVKADVILSVDPFNPDLLAGSIEGLVSEYPFRADVGPQDSAVPIVGSRVALWPTTAITCADCEDLQRKAELARLNAILARVWHHLNSSNEEAARLDTDADLELGEALSQLHTHQGQAHARVSQTGTLPRTGTADQDSVRAIRYAIG